MEQRHRQANPVGFGQVQVAADAAGVVHDAHMFEHHALGEAGRPGRVLHVDDVIGCCGLPAGKVVRLRDGLSQRFQFGQGIRPFRRAFSERHDPAQSRRVG